MEKIVKYANRKLYSKTQRKYVSLANIVDLIKEKKRFSVKDNKTGKSLTNETLKAAVMLVDTPSEKLLELISGGN